MCIRLIQQYDTNESSCSRQVQQYERDKKKKMDRCPLRKHSVEYHGSREFKYRVKIMSESFGKPSRRLITEALLIDGMKEQETMNSKKEWSYVKLSKVKIT